MSSWGGSDPIIVYQNSFALPSGDLGEQDVQTPYQVGGIHPCLTGLIGFAECVDQFGIGELKHPCRAEQALISAHERFGSANILKSGSQLQDASPQESVS